MAQISIRAARVNANMTQQKLAERLGVSRRAVHDWETGKKRMTKSHKIAFCTVVGISEEDIFLPKEST